MLALLMFAFIGRAAGAPSSPSKLRGSAENATTNSSHQPQVADSAFAAPGYSRYINLNCYQGQGALEVGGPVLDISLAKCAQACNSADCNCFVFMHKEGSCWTRRNCQPSMCAWNGTAGFAFDTYINDTYILESQKADEPAGDDEKGAQLEGSDVDEERLRGEIQNAEENGSAKENRSQNVGNVSAQSGHDWSRRRYWDNRRRAWDRRRRTWDRRRRNWDRRRRTGGGHCRNWHCSEHPYHHCWCR